MSDLVPIDLPAPIDNPKTDREREFCDLIIKCAVVTRDAMDVGLDPEPLIRGAKAYAWQIWQEIQQERA